MYQKWPLKKNFLACTPHPPGLPDPLEPPSHLDFQPCHPWGDMDYFWNSPIRNCQSGVRKRQNDQQLCVRVVFPNNIQPVSASPFDFCVSLTAQPVLSWQKEIAYSLILSGIGIIWRTCSAWRLIAQCSGHQTWTDQLTQVRLSIV